jgi:Kdo2-lipid IVA lauroyltransferase/acyltransferase
MILYILYELGFFLAMLLPLDVSYGLAKIIADIYYMTSKKDRSAVINNINAVLGTKGPESRSRRIAREVFRNFAKYLADFFRFQKIDKEYVKKYVKIEGLENLKEASSRGKGVIILSAHLGNWELGGSIFSLSGYPINGVVLTHKHKKINDFFRRQRLAGRVIPIEIGASLKECYRLLKSNKILGLLGDRDFTKSGLRLDFFGLKALIPKGPAVFSYRIGSAIVPAFMIRNPDDTFTMFVEKPIYPDRSLAEDKAIIELTKKCIQVIESYIRKYPSQWYAFKNIWDNNEDLRPDSVI